MATDDDDDRWHNFQDPDKSRPKSRVQEPREDLCDYLVRVLLQKSPRSRQERKFKVALDLVKLVTDVAYALSPEWKAFLTSSHLGVKTAPLRTLSEDMYEVMVPLKRPLRLDGFKIIQKPIDEMPQHRCLIQLNPALCREEQLLLTNEWRPFVDQRSCLGPAGILRWFNHGLAQACSVVIRQHHNVDKLTLFTGKDGTVHLLATMSHYDDAADVLNIDTFTVNIYPCYIVDQLPSSLRLSAPLPCFGPYIHGQKEFRRLVQQDIADGREIVYLDPKTELSSSQIRSLPTDSASWKLNLSFTEYHVYSLIDKYCRGLNFRHVLSLMTMLREEHKDTLHILNNEIIVNALFTVSQKNIDKIRNKSEWVFRLLKYLIEGLKCDFIPSFYMPRQNLLPGYEIDKEQRVQVLELLQEILNDIKLDPKSILKRTGYVDNTEETDVDGTVADGEKEGEGSKLSREVTVDKDTSSCNGYLPAQSVVIDRKQESELSAVV